MSTAPKLTLAQKLAMMPRAAVRPFSHKGRVYWISFVIMLLMGIAFGHYLSETPRLEDVRNAIYQYQINMQRHGLSYPQRTSLILLDDGDYWGDEFQGRTPLRRDRLAALIDKLNAARVNIIALDVDFEVPRPYENPAFEFPAYTAEDTALMKSIQGLCDKNRHLVISTPLADGSTDYIEMPSVYDYATPSIASLIKPGGCVSKGHIQLPSDMRRIPGIAKLDGGGHRDSLSLAVTRLEDPTAYNNAVSKNDKGFHFSQYLTEDDFVPPNPKPGDRRYVFSDHEIEAMDIATLQSNLANRIVIVGGNWHTFAAGDGDTVDLHNSPGGDMPGAMLHANYVEAMLDRTGTFTPISNITAEVLEISLALALALVGAMEIAGHWKYTALFITLALSLLLTFALMQNFGLFLDFLIPLLMIVLHSIGAALHSIVEDWLELRREHKDSITEVTP
jgi:CHASE2 domain-containing sensor protein